MGTTPTIALYRVLLVCAKFGIQWESNRVASKLRESKVLYQQLEKSIRGLEPHCRLRDLNLFTRLGRKEQLGEEIEKLAQKLRFCGVDEITQLTWEIEKIIQELQKYEKIIQGLQEYEKLMQERRQ